MADGDGYTDKDGRFRPTPDRPKKFGLVIAAGALGIGAAVGVGSGTGGAGAAARAAAGADTPTLSVEVRTSQEEQRSRGTERRLAGRGLHEIVRAQSDSSSCSADARGQVREFLETHGCRAVYRVVAEVREGDAAALVSIAWVDMENVADAAALKSLVDRPGTGDIVQLPSPGEGQAVTFADQPYTSRQKGTLVTIVEAEPEAVTPGQQALRKIVSTTADAANSP